MRILCLDPGTKRIGIALSDETGLIASPLPYIPANPPCNVIKSLLDIKSSRHFEEVIIGNPLNMDGTEGESSFLAGKLSEDVKKSLKCPVILWDERLSTRQVEQVLIDANISRKKRKELIDSQSAVVILQSYLDYKNK